MTLHITSLFAAALVATVGYASAADREAPRSDRAADLNREAASQGTPTRAATVLDQGNGQDDLQISQRIRREITGRNGLSIAAQNITVISREGRVTLQGTVPTQQERQTIEEIAQRVAQNRHILNRIEVQNSASRRE